VTQSQSDVVYLNTTW